MERSVLALAIFALVYVIILAGENSPRKLDRPAAGLAGGVLMVLTGVLTRHEALEAIDFSTLTLLFGMMAVVHYAVVSGLLDRLAHVLIRRCNSETQLLWAICVASGLLSALFVNDTICLLMTPIVLSATRRASIPPEPFLLALATSSNAGSLMAITGNPQNMLIGQSSGWGWGAFALRMAPIGLVCIGLNALIVGRIYKRELAHASVALNGSSEVQPLDRRLVFA